MAGWRVAVLGSSPALGATATEDGGSSMLDSCACCSCACVADGCGCCSGMDMDGDGSGQGAGVEQPDEVPTPIGRAGVEEWTVAADVVLADISMLLLRWRMELVA